MGCCIVDVDRWISIWLAGNESIYPSSFTAVVAAIVESQNQIAVVDLVKFLCIKGND